jgi:hypothetical protein
VGDGPALEREDGAVAADGLRRERSYGLGQEYAARQVLARGQEASQGFGRPNGDQIADAQGAGGA